MYLRKCPNKKTGRVQLDIVQAYRDKDGKSKHKENVPMKHFMCSCGTYELL